MEVLDAIAAGRLGPELADYALPDTYLAAHLRVEDVGHAQETLKRDVRETMHIGQVPLPELAPDEVLIAVMASAINYNTVWSALFEPVPTFEFFKGLAAQGGWDARHAQPYHVIGSDASGVVVRTGGGVSRWRSGDRVVVAPLWVGAEDSAFHADPMLAEAQRAWGFETNFGGLAQFAVAKSTQLMPKPAHLTWEEAACNSLCAATAYRMLVGPNGARMKQGDVVLVWGAAGGLGSFAVQLVRNGGGIPVGVVGSESKEELLHRLGCDVVLRRDELDLEGCEGIEMGRRLGSAIRERVGEDPHVVFDYLGRKTFGASVFVARRGGAVVTCGSSTGYLHEFDNRYLWMRLKRIIGCHGANGQEAAEMNRLISLGRVVPPLSRVFPLREAGTATREVQLNRHVGKVGVLCLAEQEGLGVEDQETRDRLGDRLAVFRGGA